MKMYDNNTNSDSECFIGNESKSFNTKLGLELLVNWIIFLFVKFTYERVQLFSLKMNVISNNTFLSIMDDMSKSEKHSPQKNRLHLSLTKTLDLVNFSTTRFVTLTLPL